MKKLFLAGVIILGFSVPQKAQRLVPVTEAILTEKTEETINWERYYDYQGITDICRTIAKAYPNFVRMESIGETPEGRRLWVLTVSDFTGLDPDLKPALYLDGTIFDNAFQGAEFTLFTAWKLLTSYAQVPKVAQLLREKTLYIVPLVYPDMRDKLLTRSANRLLPAETHPMNDDSDAQVDEDGPDDLNGDGFITLMRRKSKTGLYVPDPNLPNHLILAPSEAKGQYEILGMEGHDNDGDGLVNEDPVGYAIPSLDWSWNWQPFYAQFGATKYPFSQPETRAVKDFVLRHPNITAAQQYRYPFTYFLPNTMNASAPNLVAGPDSLFYHQLIQDTTSQALIKDLMGTSLAATPGGQLEWFYGARGIFPFSSVLFQDFTLQNEQTATEEKHSSKRKSALAEGKLHAAAFVPWQPYEHTEYGAIEIGGFQKDYFITHHDLKLQEDAERQYQTTLSILQQLPQVAIQEVVTQKLPNGNTEVIATVANLASMPTRSHQDLRFKLERPDYIVLRDTTVLASMVLDLQGNPIGREQKINPAKVPVSHISGNGTLKVRWVVKAAAPTLLIEVDSRKGGITQRRF